MPKLNKVKILICDTSYGNNVLKALREVLGNTVSIELTQNGGLHMKPNMYDVVFISGQDFLLKKNTIDSFRKEFCSPNYLMIIMSSSANHLALCNSQSVLCVDRNKMLRVGNFSEMQDFLIKIANRESVEKHDALWKGPLVDPIHFGKKDPHMLRYRRKMRRIMMVISMFCIINFFLFVAFTDKYIAFMLYILHLVKSIL
ncbi:MAG: hypothetical protein WC059_02315 [Candidatus Paceibacterota bacterium]